MFTMEKGCSQGNVSELKAWISVPRPLLLVVIVKLLAETVKAVCFTGRLAAALCPGLVPVRLVCPIALS